MKTTENQPDSHALSPVFLPEFGHEVSWAMCRNAACPHFGYAYEGPPLGDQGPVADARLRIERKGKGARVRCKYCEQSFTLKSNRAIRPLARYFLQHSLPFADCPNPVCGNHGLNVFENFFPPGFPAPKGRKKRYRREHEHSATCRSCGKTFRLGEALHLRRSKATRESLETVIRGVRTQVAASKTIDYHRMPMSSYYSRLRNASVRLRDWHAMRNAKLLHEQYSDWEEPLLVFTDVLEISLQRAGQGSRHTKMKVIVTCVSIERTYFTLAAHPYFLPDERCPHVTTLMDELDKPRHLAEWDCLRYGFESQPSDSVERMMRRLPDLGRGGYFAAAYYAELAHFLVVRKMLSRFPKVHHYMDGAVSLFAPALTAFAADIRDGRVEIALFQYSKEYKKAKSEDGAVEYVPRPRLGKANKRLLDEEWSEMQRRLAEEVNPESGSLGEGAEARKACAKAYRAAQKGAYSKKAHLAWLWYPPPSKEYENPRTVWLTWNPHKSYREQGRNLLLNSTLHPVDSNMNILRHHAKGVKRGQFRAKQGRSYQDAYVSPQVVLGELWIALLWRNYGVRYKTKRKVTPAKPMQLAGPTEPVPDLVKLAWNYRLGLDEAANISLWASL